MKHIGRSIPVWQIKIVDIYIERLQQLPQLLNAGSIRTKTASGKQSMLIKPNQIAAFSGCISINPTQNRNVPLMECIFECWSFTSARDFDRLKNNCTTIGNDAWIVSVD